ncbi:MAG: hypothetical protein GTO54_12330, partial [Nitrososphaeria archaeon]|nr:hypothetical protein [Nitrososphaeria archaeon]
MARRKVKYDFDPLKGKRRGMSKTKQERIERKVAKFVQEKVTSMTEQSKSPVFGKKDFKELSPKYKDKKKAAGKGDKPNLRFNGELMSKVKVNRR